MKNLIKARQHHEKSISLLELIEYCEQRIGDASYTADFMHSMALRTRKHTDKIDTLKKVKQRLISYYIRLQEKNTAMLQLGNAIVHPEEIAA